MIKKESDSLCVLPANGRANRTTNGTLGAHGERLSLFDCGGVCTSDAFSASNFVRSKAL